ncbi:phosphatase PAP2 family protein [Lacisediminihabitans sp. H27-G8]|uniref:phosphatase PAP2 family protein n=1 Tax=Lacisediminihabitans sp. H27-G8 TaxID=3111909 RepID=UPI0038FBE973
MRDYDNDSPERTPTVTGTPSREARTADRASAERGFWRSKFVVEERYLDGRARRGLYIASAILIVLGLVFFTIVITSVLTHTGVADWDRPMEQWVNSLRSPVTTVIMIVLTILIVSRNPKLWGVAVGLGLAWIGVLAEMFSRMYLGYHWFSDTLGSLSISMVIVGTVIAIDTRRTVRVRGEAIHGAHSQLQKDRT